MLNLQLSLALCLLVLGFWLEYLERPRIAMWFLLLTLTTALYFTHLVGFAMAGWIMTAYAIFARRRIRDIFSPGFCSSQGRFFSFTPPCLSRSPVGHMHSPPLRAD